MNMAIQGSQQWLAARQGKITASVVGKIITGNGKGEVLRDMVREALGYPRAFQGNVATDWGTEHEDEARTEYAFATGNAVEETGFHVHPRIEWMGASPDGLVGDDGLLELKCPYKLRNADEVPDHLVELDEGDIYWHQMQCQMHVLDRQWCDFGVWCPGGIKIRRYEIDPDWIAKAEEAGNALIERVQEIVADPELAEDFADITQDMSKDDDWVALADQYAYLDDQIKAMKKLQEEVKESLVSKSGKRKAVGHGVQVIPVTRQGGVDYNAMAKASGVNPDDFRKPASTSWQIRISKENS